MEYANWFVVVMGVGIVFFGLIVLIIAVTIMGKILGNKADANDAISKAAAAATGASGVANAAASGGAGIDQGFVAAISAVIAEEMGADIGAIRIKSIKQV